ncbi:glycogen debranching enzyme [Thermogymnomonas acidicola]|uniref:Glycogen debranching enzyme n=1 Tax=Thermogymnomonas acidicola TaxID=399579 RepID=A0AA37F9Y0_9ARCH|nr:glycogen debranching protein GlgX [Thermogymnomonas acidicola]GGM77159.1 glycogen debranching enzyme [Thermogymnomonas acidicola]
MLKVGRGSPFPVGPTWSEEEGGVNFSIFSENATAVYLEIYGRPDDRDPKEVIEFREQDAFLWHSFVSGLGPGTLYGYRVDGPYEPEKGLRFNRNKLLIDPYTRSITSEIKWSNDLFGYNIGDSREDLSFNEADDAGNMPKCVIVDGNFDWKGDRRPRHEWTRTVIYETHVKGITARHPEIEEEIRGTYKAMASDRVISYLKDLGITSVELMPVHHHVDDKYLVDRGLRNYWGYNTIGFFAPDFRYSSDKSPGGAVREFKEMVRRLHENGIEVILDVVYNHTAEGNHLGPTLSFRGIDNLSYYRLDPKNPRYYVDFTGTGNSLNASNPYVLQMVMDSLRYWVLEMHVDGFRFDLAATLARQLFDVDRLSAFFDIVHQDPVISRVKLIAEPWDVGPGGYQVGQFPALWAEWNGKYRDSMRRFWRGDPGMMGEFATRLSGSPDLYEENGRRPHSSINYITCHDGFTLNDLVSYERKHNEANGHNNEDGTNDNYSVNFGVEGPTEDREILAKRMRRMKNFMITLFTSQGVPMLLGGDEIMRTQQGNNNAYCQDNEISWYDWNLDERKKHFLEFVKLVIHLRRNNNVLRRRNFLSGERRPDTGARDVIWLRPDGTEMTQEDWSKAEQKYLAVHLSGKVRDPYDEEATNGDLILLFNASDRDVMFNLPHSERGWKVLIDSVSDSLQYYPAPVYQDRYLLRADSAAVIQEM